MSSGLFHLHKAQAAVPLGAVKEEDLRLVFRGHQHQGPAQGGRAWASEAGNHALQSWAGSPSCRSAVRTTAAAEGQAARSSSGAQDAALGLLLAEAGSARTPLIGPKPQCLRGAARYIAAQWISAFSTGLRPGRRQARMELRANRP